MIDPFEREPVWQRGLGLLGLLGSVLLHAALARGLHVEPGEARAETDTWVELSVFEPPPPPPPPPEPPPEPEPKATPKPKSKTKPPDPVKFEQTVAEAPPEAAPQTTKVVRRVQGLSATSFAKGSGTGLAARAGTTLAAAAGPETLTIEEASESVAYAAATVAPRCREPVVDIPQSVIEQELTGSVRLLVDITAAGGVTNVRVTTSLGAEADAACVAAWSSARCKPGMQGSTPVKITDYPRGCRYKAID